MKTDNELIAEFMGGVFHKLDDGFGKINERWFFLNNPNPHANASTYKSIDDLDYHKRWDWLMPVVEKISSIELQGGKYGNKIDFQISVNDGTGWTFWLENVPGDANQPQAYLHNGSLIEKTYYAVVEFIKYYNSQLSTPKQ